MIKTLHTYISRELGKVAVLALVALTVVMTIVAIIEPLRKFGLSTSQAVAFFGYTLPVMFSLTLPIAALFATTIVYGRFSQDNELLACRASGISTIRLLKPALVLGAIVTVASLVLSSFVAPKVAGMGERAIRDNVRSMAYHRLRTRNYLKLESLILHADRVYPERDALRGVVIIDTQRPTDHRIIVASEAHVKFDNIEGQTYCSVNLGKLAIVRTKNSEVFWEASQQIPRRKLPGLAREKPAFFDWLRLLAIRRDPARHPEIRRALVDIRHEISKMMLAKELTDTINAGKAYIRLQAGQDTYEITAGTAKVAADGAAVLGSATGPDGRKRRVTVKVKRRGAVRQTIISDSGKVKASWLADWQADRETWLVSISLEGPAQLYSPFDDEPSRRDGWKIDQCVMPPDVVQSAEKINLTDLYDRAEAVTANEHILNQIKYLKQSRVPKLIGRVTAEIHGRPAYCLSCFLLVAMGGALGLIFRGGQMISAFALSVIPAAVVIVMILMGKEMVSNPDSSRTVGLMAIWGGNLMLLIADSLVYLYLRRK